MTDEKPVVVKEHQRNKPIKSKPPETAREKIPHAGFSDPQERVPQGVTILSKSEKTDGARVESKSAGGSLETTVQYGLGDTTPLDGEGRRQHS